MAQLHFGVVYDTESGEFYEATLQEMPVDSDEYVFEHDEWRKPTADEIDVAIEASQALGRIFEFTNDVAKGRL